MKRILTVALALSLAACSKAPEQNQTTDTGAPKAALPTQGVSDTEIVVGGMHDLSGIFAAFSVPAVTAANMHFDEINAAGGIHGRKIRYIIEDHGYQVPKAVQAANKLVTKDKVFAMLLNLGTPQNVAAFPIMDRANVANVVPLGAGEVLLEGNFARRFTFGSTYYKSIHLGINHLVKENNLTKLCSMYIPSDFGEQTKKAIDDVAADTEGVSVAAESSHRPDDTDFSGALTKLKDSGCELVAVALGVRPGISVVATARSMGWKDVKFIFPSSGFHEAVAVAPGGVTEGLYVVSNWIDLNNRDNEPTKQWMASYKEATGKKVNTGTIYGYVGARIFTEALKIAGKDLTAESFSKAMEQVEFADNITGLHVDVSPETHQAVSTVFLSQVQNGVWKPVTKLNK